VCVCEYVFIRQPLSRDGGRWVGCADRTHKSRVPRLLHARGTVYVVFGYGEGARAVACVVLGVVYLCGTGPVPPWVGPAAAAVDPRASTPRRRSNCRRTIGRRILLDDDDDDDAAARRAPLSVFLINTYTRSDVLQYRCIRGRRGHARPNRPTFFCRCRFRTVFALFRRRK